MSFPYGFRKTVGKKRGWKCEECGKTFREGFLLEFHHITPSSWGGKDTEKNCQILCIFCHLRKHIELAQVDPRQWASVNLIRARLKRTSGS